ncbi:MAG: HD domain-containing protein [Phycisphaerae bacterium]|nr:HD domain-containing protein [Phycisphaerae bacterium]
MTPNYPEPMRVRSAPPDVAQAFPTGLFDNAWLSRADGRPAADLLRDPYPHGGRHWLPFDRCSSSQVETLLGLMGALHAYDPHTSQHSIQVEAFATRLATMLRVNESERHLIRIAAVLHDIGKIAVPIQILAKPAKLTSEEFDIVKRHPGVAARILEPISFLKPVVPLVRHHHEWFDGSGYEHSLAGEEIPLGARIIQTADCIDAMMSPRSYKQSYSVERVISELRRGSGTQFDPHIAEAAIACLRTTPRPLPA